jgi:hypothetical protein
VVHKQKHEIDYIGSALIFISISALMTAFIQAGTAWVWSSAPVLLGVGNFTSICFWGHVYFSGNKFNFDAALPCKGEW